MDFGNFFATIFLSFFTVTAEIETTPSPYPGDSVDDIALWPNSDNPSQSLIIATLKASNQRPVLATGLLLYNLDGEQLQFLEGGTPNNVDIIEGFNGSSGKINLIVASHWFSNKVGFYQINKETQLIEPIGLLSQSGVTHARGLCLYHNEQTDESYYFVAGDDGEVEQYQINTDLRTELVRQFKLDSTAEGCVVDDKHHTLFIAEEVKGIWAIDARPEQSVKPTLIDEISFFSPLKRDIEGLSLATKNSNTYLIASVQGKSQYAAYQYPAPNTNEILDLDSIQYVASFDIAKSSHTDAVSGSDGILIYDKPLGERFPHGIFISQDEENTDGKLIQKQNFKFTDWQSIRLQLDARR